MKQIIDPTWQRSLPVIPQHPASDQLATVVNPPGTRTGDTVERTFEVIVAALGLLLLSPLLLVIGIAIKMHDGGPLLYVATRVGRNGRLFRLYKFRTMHVNADKIGLGLTQQGDARITSIGQKLRSTKLDEIPQLFNVLLGDMSLVGPRPEDPRYVSLYTPEQMQILQVRPGITGAASLAYRHEEKLLSGPQAESLYCDEILPEKLRIDLEYLAARSFTSDLGIIARTLLAVIR